MNPNSQAVCLACSTSCTDAALVLPASDPAIAPPIRLGSHRMTQTSAAHCVSWRVRPEASLHPVRRIEFYHAPTQNHRGVNAVQCMGSLALLSKSGKQHRWWQRQGATAYARAGSDQLPKKTVCVSMRRRMIQCTVQTACLTL